jgi:hypothetical protein
VKDTSVPLSIETLTKRLENNQLTIMFEHPNVFVERELRRDDSDDKSRLAEALKKYRVVSSFKPKELLSQD